MCGHGFWENVKSTMSNKVDAIIKRCFGDDIGDQKPVLILNLLSEEGMSYSDKASLYYVLAEDYPEYLDNSLMTKFKEESTYAEEHFSLEKEKWEWLGDFIPHKMEDI